MFRRMGVHLPKTELPSKAQASCIDEIIHENALNLCREQWGEGGVRSCRAISWSEEIRKSGLQSLPLSLKSVHIVNNDIIVMKRIAYFSHSC